jgi:hypothetical protein
MSSLLWITIPGGTFERGAERGALLRVLISPRLEDNSLPAAGMEHWPPQSLVNATLVVEFAESVGGPVHREAVPPPHIRAQPGVWEAFFPAGTTVKPPQRPVRGPAQIVQVDATSSKAAEVRQTFTKVAQSVVRLTQDDQSAFYAATRAELVARWPNQPLAPATTAAPLPTAISRPEPPDFHRSIALLREHPVVLEALGLIIEMKLPETASTRFPEGLVRVRWPDGAAFRPTIVSPWTQYETGFLPRSTENISSGMVTLTDDRPTADPSGDLRWEIVTFDVDNGSREFRDAARSLAAARPTTEPAGGAKPFAMPALRTAGLVLVRRGRQADFAARRIAATAFAERDSLNGAVLSADDLVLGYRIDVQPQGRNWLSLHEREAQYTLKRGDVAITIGGPQLREEGHLKAHAAVIDDTGTLRTDEVVACWSGWSLSVPRPALREPADRPERPGAPFHLATKFAVPAGTLPRLRFAETYRLRARVADLAGGGLQLEDRAAGRCFTDAILYRRYEPVASPDVQLPQGVNPSALGPGESVAQIVIRTDGNTEFTSVPNRLLLAPRASLTLAEQHRALDGMSAQQIQELVRRALVQSGAASVDELLFPDFAAGGVCVFPRRQPGGPSPARTERAWNEAWPDLKPKEIVLKARPPGESVIFGWEAASGASPVAERLNVRLAKAEEVTLELSSFLKADFLDHFAIAPSLPGVSAEAASAGRHPMVTPARTITLTHAVKRPLGEPRGTLTARRNAGETFAVLEPDPPLLGVDPKSTAKLEIAANWDEHENNVTRRAVKSEVQTIAVNRGDQLLKDPIRHEFGDTRHRKVTYTLTAVSRFRHFFGAAEDESAFVAKAVLPRLVSIPNSARPSPPMVLSIRPAFAWETSREGGQNFTLRRRRLGGHVRVELKGPWYETGEGEQLAVIVSTGSEPPERLRPFLTQAGRDPIYQLADTVRWPEAAEFKRASGPSREAFLKEAGANVAVTPHEPWFNDGRWFADISLPRLASESYCPFVRLAVARYQPDSLDELSLSQVVLAEMVQLLPERNLIVRRSGNSLFAALDGRSNVDNSWTVTLERFQAPPGTAADAVQLTALETMPAEGIPSWIPVANQLQTGKIGPQELQLQVPANVGPLRLRIQEVEDLRSGSAADIARGVLTARTVYSEVVALPET